MHAPGALCSHYTTTTPHRTVADRPPPSHSVLNPGNSTATPNPTASATSPAFSGASSGSSVPFTSGVAATGGAGGSAATTVPSTAGGPVQTAAVGAAALFGGAAFLANM